MTKSDLLNKYKIETLDRCNRMVRFACIFVMFGNPLFLFLDYFQTSYELSKFIFVRSFMSIGVIVVYFFARSKYGIKYAMWLGVAAFFVCSTVILVLVHMTGGSSSPYYAGLLIILFALCIWIPITFELGLFCAISMYMMYVLPFLITNSITDWPVFLNNNYFIIVIFFLSVSSLKFYNDIRFNEFKARYEIQKSNEELRKVTRELEASNKKLLELDQIKMRFFANVSHELRTPLTLIIGPLEQLIQGWNDMDPVPMLRAMEANAHRLLRQVNTILDFAKADVGMLTCQYVEGNLGDILSKLVQASIPYAEKRNIEMTISGTDEIPDTAIDIEKVETIAVNLISNALKFTSDNGKVSICAGKEKEIVWFEVQDTGMGIPEDKIGQVFERFHQIDDQHSRKNEGTGLGLAMVRELTLLHGGTVDVRSEIGKGSVFRVELPMKPLSPESDRRKTPGRRKIDKIVEKRIEALMGKEGQKPSKIDQKTLFADIDRGSGLGDNVATEYKGPKKSAPPDAQKILVVEDNPDLRAFIISNLFETYVVEQAENGREGLDMARRFDPDLIVSDVMMPEMDGYEMCREIRKDPYLFDVPVILVTAKTGVSALEEGLEIGANDYIPKPFEMRELKARIAAQLKNRYLEKRITERDTRLAAIGQMTSAIVHDLKTPLNTVIGFSEIALQDAQTVQEQNISRNLELVMESCSRLNRMIIEILDFAKGFAPRLNAEPVLLVPFLETTLTVHKKRLIQQEISLVSEHVDCDDVQVSFDLEKMNRVIENLIMNSKDAFFNSNNEIAEKIIRVETKCDKSRAMVRFSDNGPGIPEEIKASIFEPFSTTGKKTGVGLGLSTVRNIVTAHSGTIDVKNDQHTGGAVFELKFPVVQT